MAAKAKAVRSKSTIESDLDGTRNRLTGSVEELIDQVHPKRVKQRQVALAKRFAHAEVENAKSLVFNARGDLRTDRLLAAGGAVAGVTAVLVGIRTLISRRRSRKNSVDSPAAPTAPSQGPRSSSSRGPRSSSSRGSRGGTSRSKPGKRSTSKKARQKKRG